MESDDAAWFPWVKFEPDDEEVMYISNSVAQGHSLSPFASSW